MFAPNFSTPNITVPANGVVPIFANGNFIENLSSGTTAGTLKITIQNGTECRFDAGDTFELPQGETFTQFQLRNTTGAAIAVQVGVAQGKITVANSVTIQGAVTVSQINNDVPIKNGTSGAITVSDTTLETAVGTVNTTVSTVNSTLKSDNMKSPLTSQGGHSYVTAGSTGLVTVVAPATNVNGIIIRTANMIATSSAAFNGLYADTAAPASATDNTKNCIALAYSASSMTLRDIFIPIGHGLYVYSSTSMPSQINYDIL